MSAFLIQARPAGDVTGPVQVTAWTGEGVTRVALCAVPVEDPQECEPRWPPDQVLDEHLLVREDTDDGLMSIADVIVRGAGRAHPMTLWNAALVTCVADPDSRRCSISVYGKGVLCFTVADTSAGHADISEAFAWAASFFHCRLVRGLAEPRATRLEVRRLGASVTLVPSAPDQD